MTDYERNYRLVLQKYLDRLSTLPSSVRKTMNPILVSDLKKLYEYYYKNDERVLLVPYDKNTLHVAAVQKDRDNYTIRYLWNIEPGNQYAEFAAGCYEIIECIPKGTYFDRLGEASGNYVCEVPPSGKPYSVSQRALPYYLFEPDIQDEWSYHRYVTVCDITISTLLERLSIFSEEAQFVLRIQLSEKQIVRGTIARVDSFGVQGAGGGIQYLLPVNVGSLLKMEAIEEVRKWHE